MSPLARRVRAASSLLVLLLAGTSAAADAAPKKRAYESFLTVPEHVQACKKSERSVRTGPGRGARLCLPASAPIAPLPTARAASTRNVLPAAGAIVNTLLGPDEAPANPDLLFGVNDHPERNPTAGGAPLYPVATYTRVLDAMKSAGSEVVRIPVPWFWLQPTSRAYDATYIAKVDAYVNAVTSRGMRAIITVAGSPCWATTGPSPSCTSPNTYHTTPAALYPPKVAADFRTYVNYVVQRWGSAMAAVEVWNEPNHTEFFRVLSGRDPVAELMILQREAYAGAKAARADVPVLSGALAYSDGAFLQRMYALGLSGVSDGVSIHPYNINWSIPGSVWGNPVLPWANNPTQSVATGVPWIRDIMVANGDADEKIWLTELGYSDCNASVVCLDRQTAGGYLADTLAMVKGWPYVAGVIVHEAWDTSANREIWNGWGLLGNDFSRKPAYCAFSAAAGGAPCTPSNLSDEIEAQDILTRSWLRLRTLRGGAIGTLVPADVRVADDDHRGFTLVSANGAPSIVADPRRVGLWSEPAPASFEICNVTSTTARCLREIVTATGVKILRGSQASGTWGAAHVTNTAISKTW